MPPSEDEIAVALQRIEETEAWSCTSCGHLMYNIDGKGYPCAGAPMPHFWSSEHNKVCSVCYSMVLTIGTTEYWKTLHQADREAQARRKDNNDRLSGRRDYFTGA